MADIKHKGFQTIETDYEELNEKIRQHRKKIFRRVIEAIILVLLLMAIIHLIYVIQKCRIRNKFLCLREHEFSVVLSVFFLLTGKEAKDEAKT